MTRAKKKLYFTSARQRMLFGRTTAGKPSRFVDEVSEDHIEKPDVVYNEYVFTPDEGELEDRREGAGRVRSRAGALGGVGPHSGASPRGGNVKKPFLPPVSAAAAPVPDFRKGDVVQHKAFGRGMITDVQPAGGDALLEVAFDTVGTKRLMAKSASAYMHKT
jgi:DNA helicase-2/ATP-dependent DNA helicase PcrA